MKGYLIMYEDKYTHLGCRVTRSIVLRNGTSTEEITLECDNEEPDSRDLCIPERED